MFFTGSIILATYSFIPVPSIFSFVHFHFSNFSSLIGTLIPSNPFQGDFRHYCKQFSFWGLINHFNVWLSGQLGMDDRYGFC